MNKVLATIPMAIIAAAAFCADGPEGGEAFASDLMSRWSDGNNSVFSPYSLRTAMSMVLAGAKGDTAKQIADAIRIAPASDGKDGGKTPPSDLSNCSNDSATFETANSLWVEQTFAINKSYRDAIVSAFGGEVSAVDFIKAADKARASINGWVEQKTHGKIKDLIGEDSLDFLTRLVLVNAVYFKAQWAYPFSKELTRKQDFKNADGTASSVDFMRLYGERFRYASNDTCERVELHYSGIPFAMAILLPREGKTAADVGRALGEGLLGELDAGTKHCRVNIEMPKFKIESQYECSKAFAGMGVVDAFTRNADLSGIAGKPGDLVISAIIHKAFIEVDEYGTEAAAATAVMMRLTSALVTPEQPILFRADRPFVFVIRDTKTGAIPFAGAVSAL